MTIRPLTLSGRLSGRLSGARLLPPLLQQLLLLLLLAAGLPVASATAQPVAPGLLGDALRAQIEHMARDAALLVWGQRGSAPPRVEVEVGAVPPQLKLAACAEVQPYLHAGTRPLGRSRIGLRCTAGARWNVSLPISVKLWAPSLVAAMPLPAGTLLEARHLQLAEVDLAERSDAAIGQASLALGRTLQRGLATGDALRQADLKTRQLFAAGDTVRIIGKGPGYAVSSEGQALGPGLEGQPARVRTEGGRIVTGLATGPSRVELAL